MKRIIYHINNIKYELSHVQYISFKQLWRYSVFLFVFTAIFIFIMYFFNMFMSYLTSLFFK